MTAERKHTARYCDEEGTTVDVGGGGVSKEKRDAVVRGGTANILTAE